MIIENAATYLLQAGFLALTPLERWNAARSPSSSGSDLWFPILMVIIQILWLASVTWLISEKKRQKNKYEQKTNRLIDAKEELYEENHRLKAVNEQLQNKVLKLTAELEAQSFRQSSEETIKAASSHSDQ